MFFIPKMIVLKTLFPFLAFLIAWEMTWKWIALYKCAQKGKIGRFVCILIFNTCGILPIIYLLIDSIKYHNMSCNKKNSEDDKKTPTKKNVKKWEKLMLKEKKIKQTKKSWK